MVSDRGYGLIKIGGKQMKVHAVAYNLLVGEIPWGMEPHHRCENKRCANPGHLELVTKSRHIELSPTNITHRNKAKTHCVNGHEFTPENTIVRHNGNRDCRLCNLARQHKFRAKKNGTRRS
jgi:hypothetical protein